jgi:hypothetical protein
MIRSCVLLAALFFALAFTSLAQSPDSPAPSQSDASKPAAQPAPPPPQTPAQKTGAEDKTKKKLKKVWTNDEIGSVKGSVSVVGDSSSSGNDYSSSSHSEKLSGGDSPKEQQIASYRDQLRQLQGQMDATEKKISELRNFKAENTSSSGGINMKQGYSMTPVADQIKQLEEKKKEIQSKIDAVEDDARKNGIDPGQLR